MIQYIQCPACGDNNIRPCLKAKDYTVSQQYFDIWHCNACTLRFTQNIPDQTEIGKYYKADNYISHTNTKKGLINRLYHWVRAITLESKKNLIIKEKTVQKGRLLDIGCGVGSFLYIMKQHKWEIDGIEPDKAAQQKAIELYQIYPQTPTALFRITPSTYDVITMWHALEHVHQLNIYIKQISILLKDDGVVFIALPNYTSKDEQKYKECWAAYDVPRHLYHFSPQSIRQILYKYGLVVKKTKRMWFDSFYICLLSEQYKTGKSNFIKGMWNGFWSNMNALFNKERCSSVIYIIEKKK